MKDYEKIGYNKTTDFSEKCTMKFTKVHQKVH